MAKHLRIGNSGGDPANRESAQQCDGRHRYRKRCYRFSISFSFTGPSPVRMGRCIGIANGGQGRGREVRESMSVDSTGPEMDGGFLSVSSQYSPSQALPKLRLICRAQLGRNTALICFLLISHPHLPPPVLAQARSSPSDRI